MTTKTDIEEFMDGPLVTWVCIYFKFGSGLFYLNALILIFVVLFFIYILKPLYEIIKSCNFKMFQFRSCLHDPDSLSDYDDLVDGVLIFEVLLLM